MLGYTALSGDSGTYEFTMPGEAVTIRVTFIRTTSSGGAGGGGWYTTYTDDSSGATPAPGSDAGRKRQYVQRYRRRRVGGRSYKRFG